MVNVIKLNSVMATLEKRANIVPEGDANLYRDALQAIRDLLEEREQILQDVHKVVSSARGRQ